MSSNLYPLFQEGLTDNMLLELETYDPVWRQIFHVTSTKMRYVDYLTWEGYQLPGFRVPGENIVDGQFRPSFTKHFIMRSFGLKDSFPSEDIDDDIYGVINRVIPAKGGLFARAFEDLYESDTSQFFISQGYASGSTVAGMSDGKSLFNTAHPFSAFNTAATWANRPTTEADLSIASVQAAITNLRTQRAPNNLTRLNNWPRIFVYDPSLDFVAHQIFKSFWEVNKADRNENFIRNLRGHKIEPVAWTWFQKSGSTGTNNAWFTVGNTHYLYFFMRQSFQVKTQPDINTNSEIIAATCRFDEGAVDARGTYGSTGI